MAADGLLMGLKMEFAGPASFLSGVFLEAWLAIVRTVDVGLQRNAQVEVISRVSSRVCFVAAAVLDAGNHPAAGFNPSICRYILRTLSSSSCCQLHIPQHDWITT